MSILQHGDVRHVTEVALPISLTAESQSPRFESQETFVELLHEGQPIVPKIESRVRKGFFCSPDMVWTCYKRNYFSVECSYSIYPNVPIGLIDVHQTGDKRHVSSLAVSLSAADAYEQHRSVELYQHTSKRGKGPNLPIQKERLAPLSPVRVPSSPCLGLDHALPSHLPLQAHQRIQSTINEPTALASQHTFERVQFKSPTMNNGNRRAQQQYYQLQVELWADVRIDNAEEPCWVLVARRASEQVVVRGRSPSHYHNEGPHLHSPRGGTCRGISLQSESLLSPPAQRTTSVLSSGYNYDPSSIAQARGDMSESGKLSSSHSQTVASAEPKLRTSEAASLLLSKKRKRPAEPSSRALLQHDCQEMHPIIEQSSLEIRRLNIIIEALMEYSGITATQLWERLSRDEPKYLQLDEISQYYRRRESLLLPQRTERLSHPSIARR